MAEIIGGSFNLDVSNLKSGIKEANRYFKLLESETRAVTSGIENWQSSQAGLEAKLKELKGKLSATAQIISAYTNELERLKKEHGEGSKAVQDMQIELNKSKAIYNNLEKSIKNYEDTLDGLNNATDENVTVLDSQKKVNESLTGSFVKSSIAVDVLRKAVNLLVDGFKKSVEESIKFEDSFVQIRKTVEGSESDYEALNEVIDNLATKIPATASNLAEIAALGGQLGVDISGLKTFTSVMSQLEQSTDLTAETAGTLIAQLTAITGLKYSDYERFASSLVALGNNFSTTESRILNMTSAIATFGANFGLTEKNMLAFSAALSSMGIESEAGSTALNKTFSQIETAVISGGDALKSFSDVAQVTSNEFIQAYKDAPAKALQLFVGGLNNIKTQGGSVNQKLIELGITEVRQQKTLGALSSGYDTLSKALELSEKAWEDNNALQTESAKFSEVTSSKLTLLSNAFNTLFRSIGDSVLKSLTPAITNTTNFINQLTGNKTAADELADATNNLVNSNKNFNDILKQLNGNVSNLTIEEQNLLLLQKELTRSKNEEALISLASAYDNAKNSIKDMNAEIEASKGQAEAYSFIDDLLKREGGKTPEFYATINVEKTSLESLKKKLGPDLAGETVDAYTRIFNAFSKEKKGFISIEKEVLGISDKNSLAEYSQRAVDSSKKIIDSNRKIKETEAQIETQVLAIAGAYVSGNLDIEKYKDINIDLYDTIIKKAGEVAIATRNVTAGPGGTGATSSNKLEETQQKERLNSLERFTTEYNNKVKELEESQNFISQYGTEYDKLGIKIQSLTKLLATQKNPFELNSDEAMAYNRALISVSDEIERLREEQDNIIDTPMEKEAEKIKQITEEIDKLVDGYDNTFKLDIELTEPQKIQNAIDDLKSRLQGATPENAIKINVEIKKLEESKAESWATEISKQMQKTLSKATTILNPIMSGLTDIFATKWESELSSLESQIDAVEKKATEEKENIEKTTKESQDRIDEQLKFNEISELEAYKNKQKLAENSAKKQRKIEEDTLKNKEEIARKEDDIKRKQFEADKANKILSIIISTAQAIASGFGQLGPIGGAIFAGVMTGIGVAQAAVVASQSYVPALANGGVVTSPTMALIGEDGKEAVMPLEHNTGWIDKLAIKLNDSMHAGDNYQQNSYNNDNSATITQNIYAKPQSTREVYLQARKALKEK